MSVQIDIAYEGELHCGATHGPSKMQLTTDAPVDNCGKGASFSPTDLVATAMGTCILTTMGIFAQRHEIDLTGAKARVLKEMTTTPPRPTAFTQAGRPAALSSIRRLAQSSPTSVAARRMAFLLTL